MVYKTLLGLSAVLATNSMEGPTIDCGSGRIADEDVLHRLDNAPHSSRDCVEYCPEFCDGSVSDCLMADNIAGCSFDFNTLQNITVDGTCDALIGKWLVSEQDWTSMSNITATFEKVTGLTSIIVGTSQSSSDCELPESTSQATCTGGNVCNISAVLQSVGGGFYLIAEDAGGSIPLLVNLTIRTTERMFAIAPSCSNQTNKGDCEDTGCKWCYDLERTIEGYQGCGVSPSVCVNGSTSGADSFLSLGVATLAASALAIKFM